LFPSMLTHAAEGEGSGEPTEPQPTPSLTQPSTGVQPPETSSSHATAQDSRDSLEGTNGNEGDQGMVKECERVSMKKRFGKKESVSKQGRKKSKPESTLDDSTVFEDQDADHGMEYIETEEAVNEGRQSGETEEVKLTDDTEVVEDKSSGDKGGNAKELVSTARPEVSTARTEVSTARPNIDAARQKDSAIDPRTPPTTTSIFDDEDIIMAQALIKSILTLKSLPTIDPKDKGEGVLKELVHEKELAEMERERKERQRQDQSFVDYIASLYDEVQAKMHVSEELAARLQMEEREMYTIEERSEKDEKMIDKMNKKAVGMDEEEVPEEAESTKVEVKQEGREENIRKRSGRRLKMKATKKSKRQKTDSDLKEEEQLRASLKIVPDEEEKIDYEVLGTRYPIVVTFCIFRSFTTS
ncbi:hypothetical protein Tco_1477306, partial [Tanacetum coccineum]